MEEEEFDFSTETLEDEIRAIMTLLAMNDNVDEGEVQRIAGLIQDLDGSALLPEDVEQMAQAQGMMGEEVVTNPEQPPKAAEPPTQEEQSSGSNPA